MTFRLPLFLAFCLIFNAAAPAAETVRIAVQASGTLAWEIDVMRQHKLDAGFDL